MARLIMAPTTTYHLQPQVPFEAEYPLTLVDGLMPSVNSSFLFIYDTPPEKAIYQADLVRRLKSSLETFIQIQIRDQLDIRNF
jgi:hypothetical protein